MLRFATGWNYFFKYAIVLANNLTAAGLIIQYWRPDLNVAIWITLFGGLVVTLNVRHTLQIEILLLNVTGIPRQQVRRS